MTHYSISLTEFGEEGFTPKSLQELCTLLCGAEAKSLFFVEGQPNARLTLRPDVILPKKILEDVLDKCERRSPEYIPMMLELCRNVEPGRIALTRINLNSCRELVDALVEEMMRCRPVSLQIDGCPNLTARTLDIINEYGGNLEVLHFGNSARNILPRTLEHWDQQVGDRNLPFGVLNTPKLRHLTIWSMEFDQVQHSRLLLAGNLELDYLECLTRSFIGGLEHFQLCYCEGITSLQFLLAAKDTLTVLNLSHSIRTEDSHDLTWGVIPQLLELRFLNVSGCNDCSSYLEKLVSSLVELSYLDVSDNGLGNLTVSLGKDGRYRMDALASREQRPLDFMNLYDTDTTQFTLVPARVLVTNYNRFLDTLMAAIMYFTQGEFPSGLMDSLEMISKETDDERFPWRAAYNLVMEVAGPNLDHDSVHPLLTEGFYKPQRLAPSQLDLILKWVIRVLSRSTETNKIKRLIRFLYMSDDILNLWNPPNESLVRALLRACRNLSERHREASSLKVKFEYTSTLEELGQYLLHGFEASHRHGAAVLLEQETLAVVGQLMELDPLPDQLDYGDSCTSSSSPEFRAPTGTSEPKWNTS